MFVSFMDNIDSDHPTLARCSRGHHLPRLVQGRPGPDVLRGGHKSAVTADRPVLTVLLLRVLQRSPGWFKAVQGLMSCAVATSLLSLLIGLFSLCCYCESCNAHQAAGAFINLTFVLVAVAVCLFGAKAHLDFDVEVEADDDTQLVSIFGWSFWVAVGAGGMALVSSILYICVGRKDEYV
ncbi:hypothetical protein PoB_003749500 [Plakobranchus ocellatus]|uniref:Uncharacterized protein n=1 Tax=Plakobranchus ocellatus TaxID=259542 RepID=A0AAV4ARR8_9GAST|nr:hypothetical protein PoB_003749500 [Plakobranchus ocellatus]